jgi:tetratricopeptide (TPR) repeat protein
MDADEALAFTDELIFEATGEHLDDLTSNIFIYSWKELTYDQIAEQVGYENSYVRDVGSGLFRQLRKTLAEPVDKRNFRAVLQRHRAQRIQSAPAAVTIDDETRSLIDGPAFIGTANFLGRDRDVTALDQWVSRGEKLILIHGEGGIGKTTLARNYLRHLQLEDFTLELFLAAETQITPAESVVAEWLRLHFNEEATAEWGINLGRLRHKLRSSDRRFGVLIDSFEVALNGNGQVVQDCRCYVELLQMLSDPNLQAITLLTSRERLQEVAVQPECYPIEGLSEETWTQFFRSHHITGFTHSTLTEIWQACGGNPKAMKIIGGTVQLDFEDDLDRWWQELGRDLLRDEALKSLVEGQFERLQNTSPVAYQLLCRLGAYRFQDVSYVSAEGVMALLWDVPESERRSVLRALQNRCLVEARGGKKFWLHPIIRSAAIARIRPTPDWPAIHRHAAQFWQDSTPLITTVEDALRALEAYHHLVEIGDFDAACDVITAVKDSLWGPEMQLGWLFYRLGLLKQINIAIEQVLPEVPEDSRSGRLRNLLGYSHRLSGDIHRAIGAHEATLSIAQTRNLEQLTISSLFNLGLCYRDLWELQKAQAYFEQVQTLARTTSTTQYSEGYIIYSQCCLAYVHSCGSDRALARILVTGINTFALSQPASTWGTGYSLLFVAKAYKNLREFEAADELFQDTLHHARRNHFAQIEAKALHGLAQVYRERGDTNRAVDHHHQALEILARLGARSDQAETYLQLAVTYDRMSQLESMRQMRQKSIDLFRAIQAPKRVQWVIDKLPQE